MVRSDQIFLAHFNPFGRNFAMLKNESLSVNKTMLVFI